ncbi:ECF transporter S component [Streptococcus gordonii]|uniref:ECF transporter S component n=1 Tax=Streptococcus gordonii TaxID=1302 RepID=UPI0039C16B5D
MTNNKLTTCEIVELSLFSALIALSIQFFRIPVGPQFIHFGNALVVVAALIYGARKGALVATVGLGVFDILNGYASVVWITILEALVVILVVHFVYEAMPKCRERLVIVGFAAALTKIVLNLFKYTLIGMLGNLTLGASLNLALAKIVGTFGSSLATVIAVPILYPIFKKISETIRK